MTLLQFLNENDRFAAENGMRLIEVGPDYAVAEMTVGKSHLNAAGLCQGGALFTFADLAMAAVMNASGNITVGIENTMTYHHSAKLGDTLRARAFMASDHRKVPFCRVEIRNADGLLLTSGSSLGFAKEKKVEFDSLM